MIVGIGNDIVEVSRISKSIESEAFRKKVFSKTEIDYCDSKVNKGENFAVRFAAKESFLKALGTGLRGDVSLNEIQVVNDELGKPSIQLIGKTLKTLSSHDFKSVHLTLSHVKEYAIASVIIES